MADETAWLIEMVEQSEDNKPPSPRWWHPGPNLGWVWDANKALRFARQKDAEDYIASTPFLSGKATEHKWCDFPAMEPSR